MVMSEQDTKKQEAGKRENPRLAKARALCRRNIGGRRYEVGDLVKASVDVIANAKRHGVVDDADSAVKKAEATAKARAEALAKARADIEKQEKARKDAKAAQAAKKASG